MGNSTPEEDAVNAAVLPWSQLPATVARTEQVAAILRAEGGHQFNADGITRALQINIALQEADPIEDVVEWMERTRQFPFDKPRKEADRAETTHGVSQP